MKKITTTTKAILTACFLLLLNISVKSQSNTVTIGNMNTNYVYAVSPFYNYYNYSWADNIYLTTDIGQAGKITQIAFYVYEGTTFSMGSQKILMRETSASSFSVDTYPGETGFTTVFNGTISYNFSGNSGWQVITLTTPFTYDGLNNLEVLTENEAGTYTNSYQFFDVTTGYSTKRMKTDYNDASFPSSCVNCGYYSYLTNIQLTMTCAASMTVSPSSATICNGNSTSLTASGESTYTWSPSTGLSGTSGASVTANPTVTTTYNVSGTDASSCIQTQTVTVTVNSLPTISISPTSATICAGSSTTLTASGASSYTWSPTTGLSASTGASVTANPSSTTTYTVTGTGSNGCTNTKTVVVNVNPVPSLTFSPSSPAICIGSTTTLTASGASTYTWSPSTGLNTTSGATVSANPTVTTTYSISATGSNGCAGTQTLSVTVNALPTLTLSPSSPAVCNGSSTTLTASGANTYTWSPSTGLSGTTGATVTASPTVATNYTLTGTNANGCVNTNSFSVTVNGLPNLSISPSSATICTGTSTNLTASGASTYTWSPNTGLSATTGSTVTANPTSTITYSISGTNANGCVGTTTVTVNVNPLPTLNITATPTAICVGFSSNLAVTGATTYTWSPNTGLSSTTGANVTANPSSTTLYSASGTNANGCVGTQTINLIVNPLPNLSINPSTPIVLGGQGATITANGATTYSWSPATNLSSTSGSTVTANPQITTNYTLTGTSSAGCISNDMFSVGVELWQQTADTFHAPIYYNGNVGIGTGTNTPQAALDVVGNAIVTGTLTAGGLNSTNGNLNVSTPAVFTNTVTVATLSVTGGATFDSMGVGQRLNFGQGSTGISYKKDTSSNNQNVLLFGNSSQASEYNRLPTSRFCTGLPTNTTNNVFSNNITLWNGLNPNVSYSGGATAKYLDCYFSNNGAYIDLGSGTSTDMLFINSICGKSVAICTGAGGSVYTGNNLQIGGTTPSANNAFALNILSSAATTAINVQNTTSNASMFSVDNAGNITSNALALSGATVNRSLYVNQYGTIVTDAGGAAGASWVLGGNVSAGAALGTTDGSDLPFIAGTGGGSATERMRINGTTGNVGIGTIAPYKMFTVNGDVSLANYSTGAINQTANGLTSIEILGSDQVPSRRGITVDNDPAGDFNFYINNNQGAGTTDGIAEFKFLVGTQPNTYNNATNSAGATMLMKLNQYGQLILGTPSTNSNHQSALLTVKGDIVSQAFYVTSNAWSDFVFDNNYKLMSLTEVEKYYKQNHHLPDVPSEKEIQEKGNNVGETDAILLQKIEELTLYLVQQQKDIEALKKQNQSLNEKINGKK